MKSQQLLTQGKVFEDEALAGTERSNNPAEEVPEPPDHAKNLTGTSRIELIAKSLTLRMYDVLTTHKGFVRIRRHAALHPSNRQVAADCQLPERAGPKLDHE